MKRSSVLWLFQMIAKGKNYDVIDSIFNKHHDVSAWLLFSSQRSTHMKDRGDLSASVSTRPKMQAWQRLMSHDAQPSLPRAAMDDTLQAPITKCALRREVTCPLPGTAMTP
jgi:hypothetical protein